MMRNLILIIVAATAMAFTATSASAGNWNLKLPNLIKDVAHHSTKKKSNKRINTSADVHILVDISEQRMRVYEHGRLKKTWKVSTGKDGHPTPKGRYSPTRMYWQFYATNWGPKRIPMPHSIFFKGPYAIHGTTSSHRLGSRASHGCVRLSKSNAYTLYQLVKKHGRSDTKIEIKS